jgi:hypothetical protein
MTIVIFLFQFRYRGVDLHLDRSLANGRVKDLISFLHNKLKKVCIITVYMTFYCWPIVHFSHCKSDVTSYTVCYCE